jgi:hypothetical protein
VGAVGLPQVRDIGAPEVQVILEGAALPQTVVGFDPARLTPWAPRRDDQ